MKLLVLSFSPSALQRISLRPCQRPFLESRLPPDLIFPFWQAERLGSNRSALIHSMYCFSLSHFVHDPAIRPSASTMPSTGQCGGIAAFPSRPSRHRYFTQRLKAFCDVPNRSCPFKISSNLRDRLSEILRMASQC